MLKRFSLFIFVIMMGVTVAQSAHAEETVFDRVMRTKTINCGYYIWLPNIQKDANTGKLSGINYDIVDAMGKTLDLKINWVSEIGIGDISAALASNKIDVMCATMWPSPARFANTTSTTRPQFYSLVYPIVRVDEKRFGNDLKNADKASVKVAAIEGDVTADIANEKLPHATKAFIGSASSPAELLMQISTKKADIMFLDRGAINEFSKTNPGVVRIADEIGPIKIYGEHNLVKLGEHNLRDVLDMALLQLINDGVVEELTKKYSQQYNTVLRPPAKEIAE